MAGYSLPNGESANNFADISLVHWLDATVLAAERYRRDTVAALARPEMSDPRLRDLVWRLKRSGIDLCVAPTLLDVAGPQTTINPVASLPMLHPELSGLPRMIKSAIDRVVSAVALLLASHNPRITGIRAELRRWSLDELPQPINVLIRRISLVGPRLTLPEEIAVNGDHVRVGS
jgi:Bacterial sugar transferase